MKAYHTSQFSTLSSQLSSCPQIFTDFKDFSQAGRQLSIFNSEKAGRLNYALCIMNYELLRRSYKILFQFLSLFTTLFP